VASLQRFPRSTDTRRRSAELPWRLEGKSSCWTLLSIWDADLGDSLIDPCCAVLRACRFERDSWLFLPTAQRRSCYSLRRHHYLKVCTPEFIEARDWLTLLAFTDTATARWSSMNLSDSTTCREEVLWLLSMQSSYRSNRHVGSPSSFFDAVWHLLSFSGGGRVPFRRNKEGYSSLSHDSSSSFSSSRRGNEYWNPFHWWPHPYERTCRWLFDGILRYSRWAFSRDHRFVERKLIVPPTHQLATSILSPLDTLSSLSR